MVISTHMDDEWLWFGGIIPYYDTVLGHDVQVVYMANCGRLRYGECMNALGVAGVNTHPIFLGLVDERIDSLNQTLAHWGGQEAMTQLMVKLIRERKPEVILTHDWNGEYGHNQHILTSRCMETVIKAAADPALYPELGEAWQVQKLYRHLEKKCAIEFDWHQSFPELGGRTLLQTADQAMKENASQTKYYQVKDHGEYDNAKFGLSYSTVGDDMEHKDLFENVVFATPEPTPAPTPEPTPVPEITATPEPTPEPVPVKEKGGAGTVIGIIAAVIVLGAGAFLGLTLYRRHQEKKRREALRRRAAAIRRARMAREAQRNQDK
jgi:LmbE family N-acetylglucosaminyl deacetylase